MRHLSVLPVSGERRLIDGAACSLTRSVWREFRAATQTRSSSRNDFTHARSHAPPQLILIEKRNSALNAGSDVRPHLVWSVERFTNLPVTQLEYMHASSRKEFTCEADKYKVVGNGLERLLPQLQCNYTRS